MDNNYFYTLVNPNCILYMVVYQWPPPHPNAIGDSVNHAVDACSCPPH